MEWTIYGENRENDPTEEGWYIMLFRDYSSGEVFPLPTYFQFAWNTPKNFDGTIEYYARLEKAPIELVSGRIF